MTYRTLVRLWARELWLNVTTEPWLLVPHFHRPDRVPKGDAWYCSLCGSRSARVQRKGRRKEIREAVRSMLA